MQWNVYNYDMNQHKMRVFDIFKHGRFTADVEKNLKKCADKAVFAEKLNSDLMYYFLCKAKYEILISAWVGGNGNEEELIDIYQQVMLNWDVFLDYVWSHKSVRKVRIRKAGHAKI